MLGASKEDIELFGKKLNDIENSLYVYGKLIDGSLSIYESDIYELENVITEIKLSKISRLERYVHKIDNIEKRILSLLWVKIWNANKDIITNPDLLKPGMKLRIPKSNEITSEEEQLIKLYYKK